MSTFEQTPINSSITEIAGLVVAGTNENDLYPAGTAFLISPSLALTARHVVDDIFKILAGKTPTEIRGEVPFGTQLTTFPLGKPLHWDVIGYELGLPTDLALLMLKNDHLQLNLELPTFNLLPPFIGERIVAFGYPKTKHRVDRHGLARLGLNPHTTTGLVQEVHYEKRDSANHNYPCFQTDANFEHGMSGGPVFGPDGYIMGCICSGFTLSDSDQVNISYASLIWPFLGICTDPYTDKQLKRTYVYDLVRRGKIKVLNIDYVNVNIKDGISHLSFKKPPGG